MGWKILECFSYIVRMILQHSLSENFNADAKVIFFSVQVYFWEIMFTDVCTYLLIQNSKIKLKFTTIKMLDRNIYMIATDENDQECLRIRIITFRTNPEDYHLKSPQLDFSDKVIYGKKYEVDDNDTVFSDESEGSHLRRMVSGTSSYVASEARFSKQISEANLSKLNSQASPNNPMA